MSMLPLLVKLKPDSKDNNLFRYCGDTTTRRQKKSICGQGIISRKWEVSDTDTYTGEEDEPESLHLYAYCGNDGVNSVNPSGHDAVFLHYGYAVGHLILVAERGDFLLGIQGFW